MSPPETRRRVFTDTQKDIPLPTADASKATGIPRRTLQRWIKRGYLTTTTINHGKRVEYRVTIRDVWEATIAARREDARRKER